MIDIILNKINIFNQPLSKEEKEYLNQYVIDMEISMRQGNFDND